MRYGVVIEKANGNYSAYVPDLPGCVATGRTVEEVEREIREAIRFHIDGLCEDGLLVPEPTSICQYVVLDEPVPADIAAETPVKVVFEPEQARHVLDRIAELAAPDEMPPDYAEQHEHYVKGTPPS
ncbi:MAG: type II toxin-antitoxin system HicB family antitoxin [Phycisphaerae bacterium]|nr:type II toxin-antitoxin system HicB family antitoxin [Phycisphaerae bacterium]